MTNDQSSGWITTVTLKPPSLQDNTADADRLLAALRNKTGGGIVEIDLGLFGQVSDSLRKWNYTARCVLFKDRDRWFLTGIASPDDARIPAGLAVDLGTTTVVLRLVDLSCGKALSETSFTNPQTAVGPDILTRIHFASRPEGLCELRSRIVQGINDAIPALCNPCGLLPEDIHLAAVSGNSAMTHLFLGLDPRWMIREPYIPVFNRPGILNGAELGLRVRASARVLIFPNVGSYLGGDIVSGILYSGLHRDEQTALFVDVGTNAEVVLGNRNWLVGCAGAAGPALEGGVTRMGMNAGPGVIDRVEIDGSGKRFRIRTIGDLPPRGICGSGLIDLAAQLFLAGLVDVRGKLSGSAGRMPILRKDGLDHLVLVPASQSATGQDLTISQADLDSLIRSKAAMYTILETLTASVGFSLGDISAFYVAGTFGSFIRPESAITIGMIPDLPRDRFRVLGNSSLEGAALALKGPKYVDEIDGIRDRITYLELNVNQDFMNRFSAAKFIPHTDRSLFPSVAAAHLPAEHPKS